MLTCNLYRACFRYLLPICLSLPLMALLLTKSTAQAPASSQTPAGASTTATTPFPDNITPQMRTDDVRLNTPVTLDTPRIALGELLDKLKVQSGVDLTIDDREPLSGIQIFAVCDKTPLGDVLDRLWSLLSFQNAAWQWRRSGHPGEYRYHFGPTRAAVDFPSETKKLAQALFERHARTMMEIASLPPEERKTRIAQISASMLQIDDRIAQALTAKDEFRWYYLRVLAQALTPEQQQNVFNRGSIELNLSEFPQEIRDTFHAGWKLSTVGTPASDGDRVPMSEPAVIKLEGQFYNTFRGFIAPVWLTYATSKTGRAGAGILGFELETPLRGMTQNLWMLPGDSKSHPFADRVCDKPANSILTLPPLSQNEVEAAESRRKSQASTVANTSSKLQGRFEQLAQALPIMVLGLLPESSEQGYHLDPPYNKTVKAFLSQGAFNYGGELMVKWRGGALLVSYPTWLLDSDRYYPYGLMQKVQTATRSGFIAYTDLAQIAAQMNERQWHDLCLRTPILHDMDQAFSFLQMCIAYPALLRENGLSLTKDIQPVLQKAFNAYTHNIMQGGGATALRALTIKRETANSSQLQLAIEFRDAEKNWKILSVFAQEQVAQH